MTNNESPLWFPGLYPITGPPVLVFNADDIGGEP
jgi:hypothetical protein